MVLYDRANRRGKVDEIEDKESSDEERFILPYNDEPDDTVESEGSDSTETERMPAQKKKRVLSDDSDDDGFEIQIQIFLKVPSGLAAIALK